MFKLTIDDATPLDSISFVVVDTETTGKYPLGSEICEIAAVKWFGGEVVDRFESLIRPRRPMDINNIQIHGISNQMVESARLPSEVLPEFLIFISNSVLVAHHCPFDLGFLAAQFHELRMPVPDAPAICSSLFSRRIIPESENHRLKTLMNFLKIDLVPEHRAMVDAMACLELFKACVERLTIPTWHNLNKAQGRELHWSRFALTPFLAKPEWKDLFTSLYSGPTEAEMVYTGGSRPGETRLIKAIGFVRSLDGDFLVADDGTHTKRFFADQISSIRKRFEV